MNRLLSMLVLGVGGYYAYKYRFRIVNVVLGNPTMRRLFVRSLMGLPFVRNTMVSTMFQGGRPAL